MASEKVLVLGIGNDILTDDGIGPKLVGELRKMDFPADITFKTAAVGGLEILEMISGFPRVFLIDAIRTKNGKPGNVYFLSSEDFKETQNLTNLHDVSFLTALELGSKLDFQIPGEIMIVAVEIVEDLEFSEDLSPALKKRFPEILSKVHKFLLEAMLYQKTAAAAH
jgi:hydrogenase maturation protease